MNRREKVGLLLCLYGIAIININLFSVHSILLEICVALQLFFGTMFFIFGRK